jgi:hypothetical protein
MSDMVRLLDRGYTMLWLQVWAFRDGRAVRMEDSDEPRRGAGLE